MVNVGFSKPKKNKNKKTKTKQNKTQKALLDLQIIVNPGGGKC